MLTEGAELSHHMLRAGSQKRSALKSPVLYNGGICALPWLTEKCKTGSEGWSEKVSPGRRVLDLGLEDCCRDCVWAEGRPRGCSGRWNVCVWGGGGGRMVGVLDASYWPNGASESQCIENGPCILEAGGSSRAQTWRVAMWRWRPAVLDFIIKIAGSWERVLNWRMMGFDLYSGNPTLLAARYCYGGWSRKSKTWVSMQGEGEQDVFFVSCHPL